MLNFGVTFVFTLVNFFILFLVLRRLLFKPVTALMDARAKKIKDSLAEAAYLKKKAEDDASRYEALMAEAETEAGRIVKEGNELAAAEAKALIDKAKAEAAEAQRRGEKAVEREREKAMQELAAEIARLASEAAAKLAGREARAEDERAAAALIRDLEAGRV